MKDASLPDLHKLNRFKPVHQTEPVKLDADPSLCASQHCPDWCPFLLSGP